MHCRLDATHRMQRFAVWTLALILNAASAASVEARSPQDFLPGARLPRATGEKSVHAVLKSLNETQADIVDAVKNLEDLLPYVDSKEEAQIVCDLLKLLPRKRAAEAEGSELRSLLSLVDETEDPEALAVLTTAGATELNRILDAIGDAVDEADSEGALLAVTLLARWKSKDGMRHVFNQARRYKGKYAYEWTMILREFDEDHPHLDELLSGFRESLPAGPARWALLEWFNEQAVEKTAIGKKPHPFDTPAGIASLREWLACKDPEQLDRAISAAVSLAFLKSPQREELLRESLQHWDTNVQMESAWAAAMNGDEKGVQALQKFCRDYRYSQTAERYLEELDRGNAVPAEVHEPEFQAKAEFANWLAHPNELGKAPDEVEIVDRRNLRWPTERKPKPFWLLRYRVKDKYGLDEDDVDIGMVGSMTFCHFSSDMKQRPLEDVYAIHCYREFESAGSIQELEIAPNAGRSDKRLKQWEGEPLENVECLKLITIKTELGYPAKNVSLYAADRKGEKGWFLLDGPRSRWYGSSELPPDQVAEEAAMIHIGRRLLGFEVEPDRKAILATHKPRELTPQQVVDAYEKLLAKLDTCEDYERRLLFENETPFGKHFERYLDSASQLKSANRSELAITVFEKLLTVALESSPATREEVLKAYTGPFPELLEAYVTALVAAGKKERIDAVIEKLRPHWEHNLGYGRLGGAAFRCDRRNLAEPLLAKLRPKLDSIYETSELNMLAEIWSDSDRKPDAQSLLVDCLAKQQKEKMDTKYKDEHLRIEEKYQKHLATLKRLFPEEASKLLETNQLPETLLPKK